MLPRKAISRIRPGTAVKHVTTKKRGQPIAGTSVARQWPR